MKECTFWNAVGTKYRCDLPVVGEVADQWIVIAGEEWEPMCLLHLCSWLSACAQLQGWTPDYRLCGVWAT